MGDAGEGLIDAEAKIQERIEELQADRQLKGRSADLNPEQTRQIDSLKLARTETSRQLENATHAGRRSQLTNTLTEIDRRIAETRALTKPEAKSATT